MWSDYLCIEKCRGCGVFVAQGRDGPMCACLDCWKEHADTRPSIETCEAASSNAPVLVSSGTTYSGILKKMIYRLKYDKDKAVINDLIPLTLSAFELLRHTVSDLSEPILVPVPLHWMRLFVRGYNQAELLADAVGKKFSLPVDVHLLSRRRSTKAQHGLGKEQRRQNIVGAFRVNRWATKSPPPIILVDDIYTSGATIAEAATALSARGFHQVSAITAARAVMDTDRPRP